MQITVRLLASYRQYLPEDHDNQAGFRYEVQPRSSVGDILEQLPVPADEPYTFFVNGRHAEREQVLEPGDVLSVFPAVGGG
ncbi:MAG: MoaD/ThiS family protein [Anaerolineae bacterium]|nr:MoaD/ThiS family protein [Anaerolineae bacterium]